MKTILSLRNIVKKFPGTIANDNVSIDIFQGEIHALLGENGAGKSTLMNVLYGVYGADEGQIILNNNEVDIYSPKRAIELGIGMVHQHFMLIPALTVTENIILGMNQKVNLNLASASNKIAEASKKYDLKVKPDALVSTLSVGEQQRVEILKALYRGAKILILDEPTGVLTPQETEELFLILRQLTKDGVTVIFISHKLNEIMAICDRVSVLRRGRMEGTLEVKNTTPEELAKAMVGREVALVTNKEKVSVGNTVLKIENIKINGSNKLLAVNNFSLNINAGEIVGLAGVDGNGQSELILGITGLKEIVEGKVWLSNLNMTNKAPKEFLKEGVGHIPEDRHKQGLVLDMTVEENLFLENFNEKPFTKNHFFDFFQIKNTAKELIEKYDIRTSSAEIMAGKLSGGNQQKIILARVLDKKPKLIIAVHPTRGLDIGATQYIHQCLLEERKRGAAILLVSTELEEIMSLSDRIAVIYEGESMGILNDYEATKEQLGIMMAGTRKSKVS